MDWWGWDWWSLLRGPSSVGPALSERPRSPLASSAHLCFAVCSMYGTECWEASSIRTSGPGKARVSALLPHSMRKLDGAWWFPWLSFSTPTFYLEIATHFRGLQSNVLGGTGPLAPWMLKPCISPVQSQYQETGINAGHRAYSGFLQSYKYMVCIAHLHTFVAQYSCTISTIKVHPSSLMLSFHSQSLAPGNHESVLHLCDFLISIMP